MIGLKFKNSRRAMVRGDTPLVVRMRKTRAAFLAVLAIVLNLAVPVTHGLLATAEASEFLEICTQNGIELVRTDALSPHAVQTPEDCPACADCPLCWFGKESHAYVPQKTLLLQKIALSGRGVHTQISQKVLRDMPWRWPVSRAPPAT